MAGKIESLKGFSISNISIKDSIFILDGMLAVLLKLFEIRMPISDEF